MSITWDKMEPGLCYKIVKPSTDGRFKEEDIVRRLPCGLYHITHKACGKGFVTLNHILEEHPSSSDFEGILWEWKEGSAMIKYRLPELGSSEDSEDLYRAKTEFEQQALECVFDEISEDSLSNGATMMKVSRWLGELINARKEVSNLKSRLRETSEELREVKSDAMEEIRSLRYMARDDYQGSF